MDNEYSKSNTSLDDAARLLNLVPFIVSHQGVAIEDLATQFGSTVAEITSDLMTLWMCGLPGYTAYELIDLSFDSGFVTISNAETLERPRSLERNEALALLLGLETLREEIQPTNVDLSRIIAELISKVSLLIGRDLVRQVQAGTPASSSLRADIAIALSQRSNLRINYHSTTRDELKERIIAPLEFISRNGVEYLDAFCQTFGGFRTFRLDRIENLEVLSPALAALPSNPETGTDGTFDFTLNIWARPRDAFERFSISTRGETQTQNVTAQSYSAEWAIREIMAFGGDVTALSPQKLREQIRERAALALRAYQ